MGEVKNSILDILEDLDAEEFRCFLWQLRQPGNLDGCPPIPLYLLKNADRMQTTDLILQTYTIDAPEIIINVLQRINRNDLVKICR